MGNLGSGGHVTASCDNNGPHVSASCDNKCHVTTLCDTMEVM